MSSTRLLPLLLLLLSLGLPARAQDEAKRVFEPIAAKQAGFDAGKLAELDGLFADDVASGKLVGCLALVAHGDDVVYARTFGSQDREAEAPMTEDAIFRIYSMSKPITSVAVMMLVERGKLALDTPVAEYLPEFAQVKVLAGDKEVEPERALTVRDLLRHTSGLTYGFFGNTPVDQRYQKAGILTRSKDLAEFSQKLATLPLLHQPGSRWHYSVSTDLCGRLVEVASERRFGDFLAEELFAPLGMTDTFFTVPEDKRDRLAQMYRKGEDGLEPAGALSSWRFLNANGFDSGGGGLCSTARDYLRFAQMLLGEGERAGVRILEAETVREMTRNQLTELPGGARGFQFGLGVSIDRKGRYGWGGAAGTRFWIDPENDEIGIFMVQINPYTAGDYEGRMQRLVEQARER